LCSNDINGLIYFINYGGSDETPLVLIKERQTLDYSGIVPFVATPSGGRFVVFLQ
jgi:hypothetical protein